MSRPAGSKSTPGYCRHNSSNRAYVTLDGKPVYLGKYGTAASRAKYDRVIGEWLANGRRLAPAPTPANPTTVAMVLAAFWQHAQEYHRKPDGTPAGELDNYRQALRPLRRLYAALPVAEFGPIQMKAVRQAMIDLGWARTNINHQLSRLRHVFNWAVGEAIIPAAIADAVAKVKGLRKGKTNARESDPVLPVPDEQLKATIPFLPTRVRSMVELQLLTGMRPGEVCAMRIREIDTSGKLWVYRPAHHKTEHHGVKRSVPIGPKAQEIIRPYMMKLNPDAHLFVPAESEADRRANMTRKTPVQPSQVKRAKLAKRRRSNRGPGDSYDVAAYRRAIARACDAAFPPPDALARMRVPDRRGVGADRPGMRWESIAEWRARLGERWSELEKWRRQHRWHPHRLRHSAATLIRELYGLEAAQAILGHKTVAVTQVYAERNLKAAERVMAEVG
jgi:integrase